MALQDIVAMGEFEDSDSVAELLRMAAEDARKLDRGRYEPASGEWHMPGTEKCFVCDAGAVVAIRYGYAPNEAVTDPSQVSDYAETRLQAINSARAGSFAEAYEYLGQDPRSQHVESWLSEKPMLMPSHPSFNGWDEFEKHLDSLQSVADVLDRFESDVGIH